MLIAGMAIIGMVMEERGLAELLSRMLIDRAHGLSAIFALSGLYLVTMVRPSFFPMQQLRCW
jgi:di/tricarboxylate transporter